ncbi:DUF3352 domain-containing protein [Thermobifida halotolerans]|nr:DUF3352 domain-containing protein [Thermobifida halotolerans]
MYGGPPGPPPGRKPVWLIPVSIVVAIALVGGGVWASTALVSNLFGGPQPESVLPGSSLAFAKVDLKPTGGQWASYAQFYERLPETVKDDLGSAEDDFGQELFEEMYPDLNLDYASEVEPWLGQRFGVAVWEGAGQELLFAAAVAVEDEDLAEETLTRIQAEDDTLFFEVSDDFALLSDSQTALNDLHTQVEQHGTLEDDETFSADIADIGDGVAALWTDYGALARSETAASEVGLEDLSEIGEVTGRFAAVVRVESEYLEFETKVFNAGVDGTVLFADSVPPGGITALHDLPDNSVVAFGGDGLDGVAQAVWEANRESIESVPDYEDTDALLRELGIRLPADFHKILGTKTAMGITDLESSDFFGSGDVSFDLRLTGADNQLWSDLMAPSGYSYGPTPTVTADGDTTVVSMGTAGTGRLGDDPVFRQTMTGLEESHLALYMDLRAVAEMEEDAYPEQWGGLGGALRFHEAGSVSAVLRWVPSPA